MRTRSHYLPYLLVTGCDAARQLRADRPARTSSVETRLNPEATEEAFDRPDIGRAKSSIIPLSVTSFEGEGVVPYGTLISRLAQREMKGVATVQQ